MEIDLAELSEYKKINKKYRSFIQSKNIVDLIEFGDIVHIKTFNYEMTVQLGNEDLTILKDELENGAILIEILTHEQYEKNCYRIIDFY